MFFCIPLYFNFKAFSFGFQEVSGTFKGQCKEDYILEIIEMQEYYTGNDKIARIQWILEI